MVWKIISIHDFSKQKQFFKKKLEKEKQLTNFPRSQIVTN